MRARGLPSSPKRRRPGDRRVTGRRSSVRGAGPPATEAHREGLVEDLQEHFGPKVHAASVVKIIEIAQTAHLLALGMVALPCCTREDVEAGVLRVGSRSLRNSMMLTSPVRLTMRP